MPAGRPSREAIVLASMGRGRGRGSQMGDPFLGAILGGIGGIFKNIIFPGVAGAIQKFPPILPPIVVPRQAPITGIPTIEIPGFERGPGGFLPGEVRRRRRMNVLNPRALRRSIRRVEGFARFARRTIRITQRIRLKKRTRRR